MRARRRASGFVMVCGTHGHMPCWLSEIGSLGAGPLGSNLKNWSVRNGSMVQCNIIVFCVCVCTHSCLLCIYIYTHTHNCVYIYIHTYAHIYMQIYVIVYIYKKANNIH